MSFYKLCFAVFVFVANIEVILTRGSHHADSLLNSLKHEEWADDEEPCRTATFSLLDGVKNHTTWATWIWDSMQPPVGALQGSRNQLGSFDQCLGAQTPWRGSRPLDTQYCLVSVTLAAETRPNEEVDPYGKVQDFVAIRTNHNRRLNHYSLGVCLPKVCSPSSVAKISWHIHRLTHLPFGDVKVDPSSCQYREERRKSLGFYAFWYIILFLSLIVTAVYIVEEDSIKNPFLSHLAKWFSPTRNFKALTDTNEDEIMMLNGLRAMSAGTVVTLHYFLYSSMGIFNPGDVGDLMKENIIGNHLIQLPLLVDVFFVMSGMLLMKRLMTSSSNIGKMLIKRYLRLLFPLAMSLLYISEVLPHTVSGPLYPRLMKEQVDSCTRHWWLNVLMINNYVKTDEICHLVTWYLSCDYQLTILGTLIFCLFRKCGRRIVLMSCTLIFLVSLVIPGVMAFRNELPPILIYDIDSTNLNQNQVYLTTYTKSHSRASTYLIGLSMGYLTQVYKPKDYRHTLSKYWSTFGAILGFSILIAVLGIGGSMIRGNYNILVSILYISLDKSVFVVGICLIIIACEYGECSLVGDFFTSRIFVPLSRLSYGVYLYHPVVIFTNVYSLRTPLYYSFFDTFVNGFGYIVVAVLLSYLLWFIIEAPMANMVNYLFQDRKGKTKFQNGGTKFNGDFRQNGTKSTKSL